MRFAVTEYNVARRRDKDLDDYVKLLRCMDRMASMMSLNVIVTTGDAIRRGADRVVYGMSLGVPRNYLTDYDSARVAAMRSIAYVSAPPSGPEPDAF